MKVLYITSILSALLIIGGFFCPPIGVIDGSVLTAVGLLLMFAVVAQIPDALRSGRRIKITHADTTAEISSDH